MSSTVDESATRGAPSDPSVTLPPVRSHCMLWASGILPEKSSAYAARDDDVERLIPMLIATGGTR